MKLFGKQNEPNCSTWAALRIGMGWIMLWAFFDKLLGLGYSTCLNAQTGYNDFLCSSAWINGGSPTLGYLSHGTKGPFAPIFQSMAGNPVVDLLFMLGLLGVGVSLILGIFNRLAGYFGALMVILMFLSHLLPETNPLLDDHVIYAFVFILLAESNAGEMFGLGKWWKKTKLVKKNPLLE